MSLARRWPQCWPGIVSGGRLPVTFAQRLDDYPVRSLTPDAAGDLWYHERQQVGYRWFNARERPAARPLVTVWGMPISP